MIVRSVVFGADPAFSPPEKRFSSAAPGDVDIYSFDLSAWAAESSDTIQGMVTITVGPLDNPTDPPTSYLVVSDPSVTGNIVSCQITGGVSGTDYTVAVTANAASSARQVTYSAQLFITSE